MPAPNDPRLITFKELRKAVGLLGIFLPVTLSVGLYLFTSCGIQDSISQYYYTRMGSYLTGTLCAVGLFLIAYKGYPGANDGKWCNVGAVCAFGVAFIPMELHKENFCCPQCIIFFTEGDAWFRILHFVSAIGLFFIMAILCLRKFTKTDKKEITKYEKKFARNVFYRVCGITILACLVILAVYFGLTHFKFIKEINTFTFFFEAIMLIAFGAAWLVKGEGVKYLNDERTDKENI